MRNIYESSKAAFDELADDDPSKIDALKALKLICSVCGKEWGEHYDTMGRYCYESMGAERFKEQGAIELINRNINSLLVTATHFYTNTRIKFKTNN